VRLLVVEDEVRIAEILRKSLGRAGFAVDSVASCGDAQAVLGVSTYDAMILDLGLPDGDGLVLLGQLRSGRDQTPILVLTARDAIEDASTVSMQVLTTTSSSHLQ
jgi:two-component system response regulator QseB